MEKKTDTLFASLLGIFMFFVPVNANAQNRAGNLNAPSSPTQIEVRERTISDLLYFPFTCIEDPMTTREQACFRLQMGECRCPGESKRSQPVKH